MSRKKSKKAVSKKPATTVAPLNVKKMEQDFLDTPAKLTAQIAKELVGLKKQESSLKASLNKTKQQLADAQKRVKSAEKNKQTVAGKKQLTAAKKLLADSQKAFTKAGKDLQDLSSLVDTLAKKQSKLTALRKHISEFEKSWAKKSSVTKRKAKKKAERHEDVRSFAPLAADINELDNFDSVPNGSTSLDEKIEVVS